MASPRRRKCRCGGTHIWERSDASWLALCDNDRCGQITLPVSQRAQLEEFLAVSPRQLSAPWTRLFLRATCSSLRWVPLGQICPTCSRPDLLFSVSFWPTQETNQAALCIGCGLTTTLHVSPEGASASCAAERTGQPQIRL